MAINVRAMASGLPDTELGGRLSRCVNKSIKPWNKIVEPDPLRALLIECGVTDPVVVAEPGTHPLNTPEDWWTVVLGSGYRSTVDALSPPDRERVRVATIEAVRREKITEIRADVMYAIARRSPDSGG